MLSAPIYAKITDRVKSARNILRVGILFSIAGNCLYFMKKDKNFVVLARFISGIGWGLEGKLVIFELYETLGAKERFYKINFFYHKSFFQVRLWVKSVVSTTPLIKLVHLLLSL